MVQTWASTETRTVRRVWFKKQRTEERGATIFRRPNSTSTGWNEDFAAELNKAMDEANLRQQGKQAALRVFSSAFVECCTSSGGVAADKEWSLFKACKRVCTVFA